MEYLESAGATGQSFQGTGIQAASTRPARTLDRSVEPRIPDYLQKTYRWAYLDSRNAKYLDHELVVKTILWRQRVMTCANLCTR